MVAQKPPVFKLRKNILIFTGLCIIIGKPNQTGVVRFNYYRIAVKQLESILANSF
jgi:hypothetical protein